MDALIRETVLAHNTGNGLLAESVTGGGGAVRAIADHCAASSNGAGMTAAGAGASLRVYGSSIAHNGVGLWNSTPTALVETVGNNMVRGNTENKLGPITIQPGD